MREGLSKTKLLLLDSCVCIDFLRGNLKKGYDLMCKSDPRLFKIPSVVQAELLLGAAKSNNPDTNRFFVEQFLLPFDILPFDSRCAREYVSIRSYLEKEGKKIGPNNLMTLVQLLVLTMRYLLPITCANLKGFRGLNLKIGQRLFSNYNYEVRVNLAK